MQTGKFKKKTAFNKDEGYRGLANILVDGFKNPTDFTIFLSDALMHVDEVNEKVPESGVERDVIFDIAFLIKYVACPWFGNEDDPFDELAAGLRCVVDQNGAKILFEVLHAASAGLINCAPDGFLDEENAPRCVEYLGCLKRLASASAEIERIERLAYASSKQ